MNDPDKDWGGHLVIGGIIWATAIILVLVLGAFVPPVAGATYSLGWTMTEDEITPVLVQDSTLGSVNVLNVTDGTTTVANATLINFTSGATVSSGGTGVANIAIAGSTDTNASTACNGGFTFLNGDNGCVDLNGQYINITEEGNLNVNSSDYWDDLGTPADINAGDITDDGTYYNKTSNIEASGYNVTADWFKGGFNWTTDEWNSFDGYNLTFNVSKLSTIYYNATQYQNISGKVDGGTINDTQHPDGIYDSVTFNFSEVSGSPGLDFRMNFTSVASFNNGVIRYKTSSLAGNYPVIQLWNYADSEWEDYPALSETLTFATITQPVFDSVSHLSGDVVQMRLYKSSNGNTNNHYYVDWLAVSKGFGTPAGEEIDPFSVHRDGTTPLIANWDQGAFNLTNTDSWFLGMIDWANIQNKFITAVDSAYFYMTGTTLTLNETSLNTTIDTIVGEANTTMKNYVDTQDTLYNTTLKAYTDAQDLEFNKSFANYYFSPDNISAGVSSLNRINSSDNKTWVDTESGYDSVTGLPKIQFALNGTPLLNYSGQNGLEIETRNVSGGVANAFVANNPNTLDGSGARDKLGNGNADMIWREGVQNGLYGVYKLATLADIGGGTWIASYHWWWNASGYASTDYDLKFIADNIGLFFGANDDAFMNWNGQDVVIASKQTASPDGTTLLTVPHASMIQGGWNGALDSAPTNLSGWGVAYNDTVDFVNNAFIIERDGRYEASWDLSMMSNNVSSAPVYITIEVNGGSDPGGQAVEWIQTPGEQEAISGHAILELTAGDVVYLAGMDGTGQGMDLLVEKGNFVIERIGEAI